jgi:LruC domain-containing protein
VAPIDTDKDGVYDVSDEFPTDIKRAFKAYYPAQNTWGTLAYEDMWPQRGDYDFNDVVVDYQTTIVKNASGLVVDVNTDYRFRAAGASYRNAFAVQFNTPTSNIESVTGSNLTSGVFTLNGTKSENGQTQAVVPVTDDITRLFGDSKMVNTVLGSAKLPSVTVPIHVTFKTAINLSTLGAAPYNPFVVVNKVRGIEVHLPGKQPTEFADDKKFGTGIDLTSFNNQLFYVAKASYPWALHIPVQFEYPIEQKAIDKVFYNFGKWVTSGGALYPAWYQNSNANADQTLIYK